MRFTVLDGCRGAAALIVALFRFEANGHLYLSPLVQHAYLFVDFFFVLSGFVITHGYLDRVHDRTSAWGFVIRRFGRLWPLHVALLGAFIVLAGLQAIAASLGLPTKVSGLTGSSPTVSILTNVLLIQATGFFPEAAWNTPSWSISTEFWAYIAFAALCLAGRRAMLAAAVVIVAGSLAVVGTFSANAMDTTFDYGMFRCLAGFFAGHLTYRLWHWSRDGVAARLPAAGFTAAEITAVVVALAFVSLAGWSLLSLAAPFVFAAVIYVAAFERGSLTRAARGPVTEAIGAWSYSIYMVCLLIALSIKQVAILIEKVLGLPMFAEVMVHGEMRRVLAFGPPVVMDLAALAYIGIVLAVSWMTYTYIEMPGRRWFNALAQRRETASRTAAASGPERPAADAGGLRPVLRR